MLALPGALLADVGGENRDRHQHAGAGVADGGAGPARRAVFLAGDRHGAAGRLRDHVEGEVLLERAAFAEALHLAIDDRRVDRLDHVVAEPEALDRAGREILDHHVGLAREALDEIEAARVLEIHRGRALVGIILQEVERILVGGGAADVAAGIAGAGIFDLDHVGAHPGERLGARRPRFELGQVENLHSGKAILSAHGALPFWRAHHTPAPGGASRWLRSPDGARSAKSGDRRLRIPLRSMRPTRVVARMERSEIRDKLREWWAAGVISSPVALSSLRLRSPTGVRRRLLIMPSRFARRFV